MTNRSTFDPVLSSLFLEDWFPDDEFVLCLIKMFVTEKDKRAF